MVIFFQKIKGKEHHTVEQNAIAQEVEKKMKTEKYNNEKTLIVNNVLISDYTINNASDKEENGL